MLAKEPVLADALVKAGADPLAPCDPVALLMPPEALPGPGMPELPAAEPLLAALQLLLGEPVAGEVWKGAHTPGGVSLTPMHLLLLLMAEVRKSHQGQTNQGLFLTGLHHPSLLAVTCCNA